MTKEEFVHKDSWILAVIRDRCELTQAETDYLNILIEVLEQESEIKEAYNKGYKDGQETLAFLLKLCKEEQEPCGDCIKLPERATNGDMIKAIFPNEVGYGEGTSCIYYGTMRFDRDWWNNPYRKEQE